MTHVKPSECIEELRVELVEDGWRYPSPKYTEDENEWKQQMHSDAGQRAWFTTRAIIEFLDHGCPHG